MNNEDLKLRLEESLVKLKTELEAIAIYDPVTTDWEVRTDDLSTTEVDRNESADDVESADERVATLAELETLYRNTDRALQKMTTGNYGLCEVGGEIIEPERLEANPAARTCIKHREEEYDLPL